MTYLELMNRFWDLDQAYNFTPVEAKFYFKLLDIANAVYWNQKSLSIPMTKLQATLGVSKNTILKARKRMASTGLITFVPGQTSRCAAIYEIIGFDCSRREADLAFFESKRGVDEGVQNHSVRMNETVNVNKNVNDDVNEVTNEKATILDTIPDGFEEADFVSERTDERTCEQISERSSEQSPDPYIRIDKDKEEDQDQEAIINNLPWERFDLRKKFSQEIWDPEKIVNRFNEICFSLKKVKFLKAYTRKMLTDRNAHFRSSKDWDVFFHKVADSDFLTGKNEYQWQADLEWLVKDDETVLSILQGKYDNNVYGVFPADFDFVDDHKTMAQFG